MIGESAALPSAAVNLVRVHPGRQSLAWLKGRIAELKGTDPLAPVTVVVSSNHIGLAARRDLARKGYANVRFGVMGRLVEPLGAPALAAAGKSPLTLPSEEAAIREAVRRKGQGFGDVREHPALVRALAELFRELREAEVEATRLQELASWGLMASAALEVYREYVGVVATAGLYDDQDLLASATAKLSGADVSRMVGEIGSVLVFLPAGEKAAETRFLKALSRLCPIDIALSALDDPLADVPSASIAEAFGLAWSDLPVVDIAPPEVNLLAAPDATEEVRSAVRLLLRKLEGGLELRRIAIVYRDREPYGALIRDTLDAAAVPWAGIDGRPLSESWAGRGLLGLLRLHERDFARVDVLGWLGSLPQADPGGVSIGDWDRSLAAPPWSEERGSGRIACDSRPRTCGRPPTAWSTRVPARARFATGGMKPARWTAWPRTSSRPRMPLGLQEIGHGKRLPTGPRSFAGITFPSPIRGHIVSARPTGWLASC